MIKRILVIAPHPDDELLGVGGTILREKKLGSKVAWAVVTEISVVSGWPKEKVEEREIEMQRVAKEIDFDEVFHMGLPAACLDTLPKNTLVKKFADVVNSFQPTDIYIPHYADVHTDHQIVFDIACSVVKWFRYPCVRRVLAYETLSETDFGLRSNANFAPNIFVDISDYLEIKLKLLEIYKSEMSPPPFPRSKDAVKALARVRGAAAGYIYGEAFQLLRERIF